MYKACCLSWIVWNSAQSKGITALETRLATMLKQGYHLVWRFQHPWKFLYHSAEWHKGLPGNKKECIAENWHAKFDFISQASRPPNEGEMEISVMKDILGLIWDKNRRVGQDTALAGAKVNLYCWSWNGTGYLNTGRWREETPWWRRGLSISNLILILWQSFDTYSLILFPSNRNRWEVNHLQYLAICLLELTFDLLFP